MEKIELQTLSNESFNSIYCAVNGNIYSGNDSILIKSTDDGITWSILYFDAVVNTFTGSNNGRIYAGGFNGLYYSDDDGLSWKSKDFKNSSITSIATFKDKFVLIGTYDHGAFFSEDFGETFKQIFFIDENYRTLVAINNKGGMFINIKGWGGK